MLIEQDGQRGYLCEVDRLECLIMSEKVRIDNLSFRKYRLMKRDILPKCLSTTYLATSRVNGSKYEHRKA